MPDGASGFDINSQLLQAIDTLDYTWFDADRRIARLDLRCIPVTAAAALIYGQRVRANVLPFQPDQFTDVFVADPIRF